MTAPTSADSSSSSGRQSGEGRALRRRTESRRVRGHSGRQEWSPERGCWRLCDRGRARARPRGRGPPASRGRGSSARTVCRAAWKAARSRSSWRSPGEALMPRSLLSLSAASCRRGRDRCRPPAAASCSGSTSCPGSTAPRTACSGPRRAVVRGRARTRSRAAGDREAPCPQTASRPPSLRSGLPAASRVDAPASASCSGRPAHDADPSTSCRWARCRGRSPASRRVAPSPCDRTTPWRCARPGHATLRPAAARASARRCCRPSRSRRVPIQRRRRGAVARTLRAAPSDPVAHVSATPSSTGTASTGHPDSG